MQCAVGSVRLLTGRHVAFDLIEGLTGEEFIHLAHQVLTRISIYQTEMLFIDRHGLVALPFEPRLL